MMTKLLLATELLQNEFENIVAFLDRLFKPTVQEKEVIFRCALKVQMIFTHDTSFWGFCIRFLNRWLGHLTVTRGKARGRTEHKVSLYRPWQVNKGLHSSELRSYLITWQILPFERNKANPLDLLYLVSVVFQDSCLCVREEIQIALTFISITERVN